MLHGGSHRPSEAKVWSTRHGLRVIGNARLTKRLKLRGMNTRNETKRRGDFKCGTIKKREPRKSVETRIDENAVSSGKVARVAEKTGSIV